MVHTKKLNPTSTPITEPPPLRRAFSAPAVLQKSAPVPTTLPDLRARAVIGAPVSSRASQRSADAPDGRAVQRQQLAVARDPARVAHAHYRAQVEPTRFAQVATPATGDCYLWSVAAGGLGRAAPPALLRRLAGDALRPYIGDPARLAQIVDPSRAPEAERPRFEALHTRFELEVVGGLRKALAAHIAADREGYAAAVFGSPHVRRLPDALAARVGQVRDWGDFEDDAVVALYGELAAASATPRFQAMGEDQVPIAVAESDVALLNDRPGSLEAAAVLRKPQVRSAFDAYVALLSEPGEMISLVESRILSGLLDRQIVELQEGTETTTMRSCIRPDTTDRDPIVLYANAVHASMAVPQA